MKLQRVGGRNGWPLKRNCKSCGTKKPINTLYADLDAPAFTAYYCQRCAFQARQDVALREESELQIALCNLLEWAIGNRGSKHMNPYGVPEVKAALKVLAKRQGRTDWMDANTKREDSDDSSHPRNP